MVYYYDVITFCLLLADPEKPVPDDEDCPTPPPMVKPGSTLTTPGKKSRKNSVRHSSRTPVLAPPTPQVPTYGMHHTGINKLHLAIKNYVCQN